MKVVAIPAKFLTPDGAIRPNLTESEQAELSQFGEQPLSEADVAEREKDAIDYIAQRPARLTAFLADVRKARADSGLFAQDAGLPAPVSAKIKTDASSIANITAIAVRAIGDPSYSVAFRVDGEFYILDAASAIRISDLARKHVQRAFDSEHTVSSMISEGTLTTEDEVKSAFEAAFNSYAGEE